MSKKIESGADNLRTAADIVGVLGAMAIVLPLFMFLIDVMTWGETYPVVAIGAGALISRFVLVALATCAEAAALYIARHSDPEE